jgi:hypothetical protein
LRTMRTVFVNVRDLFSRGVMPLNVIWKVIEKKLVHTRFLILKQFVFLTLKVLANDTVLAIKSTL